MSHKLSTTDILSAFSTERIALTESILETLVPVLNEIHDTTYSQRFWKILLGSYVNSVISRRHLLSLEIVDRPVGFEAVNGFQFPSWKDRLHSQGVKLAKYLRSITNSKRIDALMKVECEVTIGFPDIPIVQKQLGKHLPISYPFIFFPGDSRKRRNANDIAERCTDIYIKNIIRLIPQAFIEYFNTLLEGVPLHYPMRKVIHVHNTPSILSNFLIAKYVEQGAKLYWYQHGAYYGELMGHNAHYFEASVSDQFRTWGWKMNSNDVPWKAYRLEKFRINYEKSTEAVIYDAMICFPGFSSRNTTFLQQRSMQLFNNLDPKKYSQILARPRPGKSNPAKDLMFIEQKNVIKDSGRSDLIPLIKKSVIVIQLSCPATNFLECLYVDHPTIGILNNEQPTPIIKPYYDFLLQAGVLHEDTRSLVTHLNTVDVREWWGAVVRRPEYKQFKKLFLNSPEG